MMFMHARPCRWPALAVVAVAALCMTFAARAEDGPSKWLLKLDIGWVSPSGSGLTMTTGAATSEVDLDTGAGGGFRAEYRITERFGVEFGLFGASSIDVDSSILPGSVQSRVGMDSFAPVTLGLNVHLTPGRAADLYFGAQVGLVRYGTVEFLSETGHVTEKISGDDDFAWGVILGLDVPVGRRGWSVQGSVRYLGTGIDYSSSTTSFDGDVNPTILSIGIGYSF